MPKASIFRLIRGFIVAAVAVAAPAAPLAALPEAAIPAAAAPPASAAAPPAATIPPAASAPLAATAPPGSKRNTPTYQEVSELEALASAEAASHLPPLKDTQRFAVGPIPPTQRQERCSSPLRPQVGSAPHMPDRVLVEIVCQGTSPWHLYVPVRIVGTAAVAVAAHAIVAGTVLTADDLHTERRDMNQLAPGFIDDLATAIGRTAARPIPGGEVINVQQLVVAKAVQRGQTVTLIADGGGMSVRMAGRALADAMVNQRVRVQNLSSGKVVEGIARSEQIVEIIF